MSRRLAMSTALVVLTVCALADVSGAQQFEDLLYDMRWDVSSLASRVEMVPRPDGGVDFREILTGATLSGTGPLRFTAARSLNGIELQFADPTRDIGGFALIADGAFRQATFTTGLDHASLPEPLDDRFLAANTYVPVGDPFAPSSFQLTMLQGFGCRTFPFGEPCNGVSYWTSTLVGTATLRSDGGGAVPAVEPLSLAVAAAGLAAAALLRRRAGRPSGPLPAGAR